MIVLPIDFEEVLSTPPRTLRLHAAYRLERRATGVHVQAFVTAASVAPFAAETPAAFRAHAQRLGAALIDFDEAQCLDPVHVPKPWGREIWHTGIEARGVSRIVDADGACTPLPWVLAAAPRRLHAQSPIVLLKTLDPLPEPGLGDLYFELHETKREVYVVTHVDPRAWPDGVGAIRFGMNQALRRGYADDAAFRRAYLDAVRSYEAVRRRIDAHASPADLPADLVAAERRLREAMHRFTALVPLSVGDVVRVPTWLPHSLQHGVRVIEFQTPVYERRILSFGQKVLTQPHWDTDFAVQRMTLDTPLDAPFELVEPAPGVVVEQIAAFEDFVVQRVRLAAGAQLPLAATRPYVLATGLIGEPAIGATPLPAETACFVPGTALHRGIRNDRDEAAVVLVAMPAA